MMFSELQKIVFEEYIKNGYRYMWNLEDLKMLIRNNVIECVLYFKGDQFRQLMTISDVAEVGLINTEVSELLEAIRKDKGLLEQGEECADIIIRVMNYCSRKGINLENEIMRKDIKNMNRGKLHGKLV
jgi:NTP pyrophosphatase (non-canonical NTP hydrolase)